MKNPFETQERRAFQETVERFIQNDVVPFANEWDEAGTFPWSLHEKAGSIGLFGFGIDEKYGGIGFDDAFMRASMGVEMGRSGIGGAMASMGSRNIMTGPIQMLANDEIKAAVLPEVVSGKKGGALGITEPSGGSDVANIKTTARRDGNHFVLNGQKTFITGGLNASHFVIGARTGGNGIGGISLFYIPADTPGFTRQSVGGKMGWWCSDTASLFFDDVRIPAKNMLGEENRGFISIMNNFNYERLGMVAQCVGMSRLCIDESIKWAQERQTFGKPMIKHQVIRHKIADMSAKIDALQALVYQICWNIEDGHMPVAEISKAKFFGSKVLEFCASEAMQILGGAGYLRGSSVERTYREVKVMSIGGGSEEIMRDLAVKQMGL